MAALERMPRSSSPGVDGVIIDVYKKFSGIFVPRLLSSLPSFLEVGAVSDAWSQCLMRCIPRHSGEVGLGDLRPICLQNSCVKWVTQVVLLQLEDALPQLIALAHKGFMRRRQLIDHVLGVRELWETHGDGGYLIIDFSKANDSVVHDHLSSYLRYLGLLEPYLRLIMSLVVSLILFCVGSGYVADVVLRPSLGPRQGDPLSPALFALLTTIVVYNLRQLNVNLQVLLYADDVLLHVPGTQSTVAGTMEVIMWRFLVCGRFSGLRVNVSKTKLVLRKHWVSSQRTLSYSRVSLRDSFRYLGIQFGHVSPTEVYAVNMRKMLWSAHVLAQLSLGM